MSLVDAVERAIEEKRTFDVTTEIQQRCETFDNLIQYCPDLFFKVDKHLFDGALTRFMFESNIKFKIVAADSGPAGLTTYDNRVDDDSPKKNKGVMCIALRRDAWQTSFPALVGGNLCFAADHCLIDVFLHEMIHVLCFCLYIQLNMNPAEVERLIPYHYDPTHNILFTTWLALFFNQPTINNSLLLCGTNIPLTFERGLLETEDVCVVRAKADNQLQIFRNGKKEFVTLVNSNTFHEKRVANLKPHHSHVRTQSGTILAIPNGLLFC